MGNDPKTEPDAGAQDEPAPLLDYPSIGTEEDLRGTEPEADLPLPETGTGGTGADSSQ
jgi:hypothetical protein